MSILARDGMLVSGGALNTLTSAIVQSAIELGIQDRYLEEMRGLYARRRRTMVKELQTRIPEGVRLTVPYGGFFCWLELPKSVDVEALIQDAREGGLLLKPGSIFSVGHRAASGLRLCFACHSEARIREGCERLDQVLRRQLQA
jgi:DNA-binding transcriptional MocR family regulator